MAGRRSSSACGAAKTCWGGTLTAGEESWRPTAGTQVAGWEGSRKRGGGMRGCRVGQTQDGKALVTGSSRMQWPPSDAGMRQGNDVASGGGDHDAVAGKLGTGARAEAA